VSVLEGGLGMGAGRGLGTTLKAGGVLVWASAAPASRTPETLLRHLIHTSDDGKGDFWGVESGVSVDRVWHEMRGVWWEGTAVEVLQAGGDCQD
jgi:hypothetical protein